ncbi:MAG: AhpC/TSA family protein [Bacteroidia bacterium]|nr:AhpC/TSA family protein [Bacteroidia bacterium]MDW8348078.1 TlpA disulfide reductase family protein [Bacteroidia bacterium]
MKNKISFLNQAFILVLLFLWMSCGKKAAKDEFVIEGTITNAEPNAKVYIYDPTEDKNEPIASSDLKEGKFRIQGKVPAKGFYLIGISKTNAGLVILGGEKFKATATASDIKNTIEFTESIENKAYKQLNNLLLDYENKLKPLYQEANQAAQGMDITGMPITEDRRKEIQLNVQKRIDQLYQDRENKLKEFVKENDVLASIIAKLYINPTYDKNNPEHQKYKNATEFYAAHFLDDIPFDNPSVAYIPEFGYKMRGFVELYGSYTNQIKQTLEKSLRKAATAKVKEAILRPTIAASETMNEELFFYLAGIYEKEFPNSKLISTLKERVNKLSQFKVGANIPEIELPNPQNQKIKLSSLRGKYVLIDFWASWCSPCRAENPNVKRLYQQYKNKGFEVYGVSIDQKREDWLKAIKEDEITWIQVLDQDNRTAQQFNVRAIPMTFLIDKNGVIIAKNLRGERLEEKLKELMQ